MQKIICDRPVVVYLRFRDGVTMELLARGCEVEYPVWGYNSVNHPPTIRLDMDKLSATGLSGAEAESLREKLEQARELDTKRVLAIEHALGVAHEAFDEVKSLQRALDETGNLLARFANDSDACQIGQAIGLRLALNAITDDEASTNSPIDATCRLRLRDAITAILDTMPLAVERSK